jgi:4-alpha-glucanotransferase
MKVQFYLRFHTGFGESLFISGNTDELGNDDVSKALPWRTSMSSFGA